MVVRRRRVTPQGSNRAEWPMAEYRSTLTHVVRVGPFPRLDDTFIARDPKSGVMLGVEIQRRVDRLSEAITRDGISAIRIVSISRTHVNILRVASRSGDIK